MADTIKVNAQGIDLEIDRACLDDYELLDMLADLDAGKMQIVPKVIRQMVGREQEQKLCEALRTNGRVPITKMANAVNEIINQLTEDSSAKK